MNILPTTGITFKQVEKIYFRVNARQDGGSLNAKNK